MPNAVLPLMQCEYEALIGRLVETIERQTTIVLDLSARVNDLMSQSDIYRARLDTLQRSRDAMTERLAALHEKGRIADYFRGYPE